MPAVQARQISELLQDLQVSGSVRNASEYEAKLRELSALVNDVNPVPSFNQIGSIVWALCASEAHNTMMKAAKNDIEASFLQVDEIGSKVEDHHNLFIKSVMGDLERNLQKQENTIRRLEWLANQSNEFSHVLANNFSSSSLFRIPPSDLEADTLYFDNRTYKSKSEVDLPLAYTSERGKKLILDSSNNPIIRPINVKLHTDQYAYGTEKSVDFDDDILNIIDGKPGTFWTRTVYLKDKVPKVNTVLEFDLGFAKDVDYMIVESGTPDSFNITNIQGVSPDGHRITLYSDPFEVNGKVRKDFSKTLVKSIIVTFSVSSHRRADYFLDGNEKTFEAFSKEGRFDNIIKNNAIANIIRDALASKELADTCNVPNYSSSRVSSYAYVFTLDNVWFGNSLYKDTGVFVSKPLRLKNPGVVAVRSDELTQTGAIQNSVEYEIIKIDRSPKYNESRFPVPKLNQTSVTSERLILTNRDTSSVINDVGSLRFLPYIASDWSLTPSADNYPVTVYENGETLSFGSDWQFAIANDSSGSNFSFDWSGNLSNATLWSNYKFSPPKFWIKISSPKLNSVYTVDYTIRTSDSHTATDNKIIWLDKNKTTSLYHGGRVNFRQKDPDVTIESDVFLQVTLRRNKSSQAASPELYEYAVLAATYNE